MCLWGTCACWCSWGKGSAMGVHTLASICVVLAALPVQLVLQC